MKSLLQSYILRMHQDFCIGALIIKEIFGISDDEPVENLMLDPRYQYALHAKSWEEQPLQILVYAL